MTSRNLVLVDGNNAVHRAYHATFKAGLTRKDGTPSGALLGTFKVIRQMVRELEPTHMLWCFDGGKSEFRLDLDPEYKGHRKTAEVKSPANPREDIPPQIEAIRELLEHLGIASYSEDGVEADDLIAQGVARWSYTLPITIYSGDHDLLQLVSDDLDVSVIRPGTSAPTGIGLRAASEQALGMRFREAEIVEKYGVPPRLLPDVWALTGDIGDNIHGIPKVGPKTAAKWINQYGDLVDVLLKEPKCREYHDLVVRNFKLICLNGRIGNIPHALSDLALFEPNVPALNDFIERWELKSMEGAVV